ncbi:hypothetical protein JTF04_11600 [Mammaliicoccus vitulinus]|uniref:hypothetical protein n=1 Tax=Mammaliicoccus vitulinus TaxID=71237 RepID=UPI001950BEE4|nr:hypothetical protein [Mammaliicoccus vitulinus]MBM6630331.1 hypothetical protein [Mammaliicoccus vitulinus]
MAETNRPLLNKVSGKPVQNKKTNTDDKDKQIKALQDKVNKLESKLADKDKPVANDDYNIKERLVNFVKTRPDGKVSDITSRATFILEDRVLERLYNFYHYMEISNASNSNYNPHNKNQTQLIADRGLSKGILSKLMSFSISESLDEWHKVDPIPATDKVRYPVQVPKKVGKGNRKVYYRAYMFELNGVTYAISVNERSDQVEYLTTASPKDNEFTGAGTRFNVDKEDIAKWFEDKKELEESDKEQKNK